jgi:hypothetical protein
LAGASPTPTVASDASDYEERTTNSRQRKGKEKEKVVAAEEEEDEVDDRLYCVCRQLYDPERMMIACDRCDNWFHTDASIDAHSMHWTIQLTRDGTSASESPTTMLS